MTTTIAKRAAPILAAAVLVGSGWVAGCGGRAVRPFVGAGLRGGEGVTMAILPFENLSKGQGAGKSMENYALVEFLKHSPVKIIDPGQVAEALSRERIRLTTSIAKETLAALGKDLDANLFLLGTVHDYDMQLATGAGGSGQVPVVAVSLRALRADTGEIVWAASATRRGNDRETVFGIGRVHSLDRLAEDTARELAQSFAASVKNGR